MSIEIKRIKCPNCGVVLDVKNSKDEAIKIITCPQCKAKLSVRFKRQESRSTLESPTFYPDNQHAPANNGETLLSGGKNIKGKTILVSSKTGISKNAYLKVDNKEYPLNIGENIIGRKAPNSKATVQIDTDDHYMSRQHAKIIVTKMPDGKLRAVISNDHNKNISTIDGQDLLQGDEIVLNVGDIIVMGNTSITYRES